MISLILYSSLIFGTLITSQDFDLDIKTELSHNVIPIHYDINISLTRIEEEILYGFCWIHIILTRPTKNVIILTPRLQIEPYSFVLRKITPYQRTRSYKPKNFIYYEKTLIMVLFFVNTLSPGYYVLKMDFMNMVDNINEDMFKILDTNVKGSRVILVSTHFQTIGVKRIFQCWDEPIFNATFNISVTHLDKHIILTSMPVTRRITGDAFRTTEFDKTPIIPPYLIAIMISTYPDIFVKRIALQCREEIAMQDNLKYAEMLIENVTIYVESQWKRCKTLDHTTKVDHIVIPGFYYDSVNKLGFVFYRESALIYDEELDPFNRKIDVTRVIGRGVAHQCFDYLVNSFSWCHLWLNEGILTLHALKFINEMYPDFRILDLFVVQNQQESFRLDGHSITKPLTLGVYRLESYPFLSFTYYIKAPAILRMLQHTLGEDIFWKGIEIYLDNQEYKKLPDIDNLWTSMQSVLDKSDNIKKFNIRSMMNFWIQLKHYPNINVIYHNNSHVKISTENALNQMITDYESSTYNTYIIPITFTTQSYPTFLITRAYDFMWIKSFDKHEYIGDIFLPTTGWLMINLQQTGYYRVNYDAIYWEQIVYYLRRQDEYRKIHVLNRAQIIDDAYYSLMHGQLSLSTFVDLTKYLRHETDYIAWYPMIKALEHMSGFFLFEQSAGLKIHMRDVLHELFKNLMHIENFDKKPSDLIKCLSEEVAKWACILDDSVCKYTATYKLILHLHNIEKILPGWKKWAYCNGLMNSDDNVWWDVFYKWTNTSDNVLLEYLSCSTSPNIIYNYLNIIVNKSENCGPKMIDCKDVQPKLQLKDCVNVIFLTVARHAKNNEILEYILKNFEEIIPRKISMNIALIIINHVQSMDQLIMVNFIINVNQYYLISTLIIYYLLSHPEIALKVRTNVTLNSHTSK